MITKPDEIHATQTVLSPNTLGPAEIKKWLRHRFPMILIDRVVSYEENRSLTAITAVSGANDWAQGHFPDRAIYPGTHIVQGFSQSAILLLHLSSTKLSENEMTVVSSMEARFKSVVVPGDVITYRVNLDKVATGVYFFHGEVQRENEIVAGVRVRIVRRDVSAFGRRLW